MKAVILAAGRGSRLNALTRYRPKHLLPITGKSVLKNIIKNLRKIEITEVGIIVHYLKDKIIEELKDERRLGAKIRYIDQGEMLGTAHAIGRAEEYVDNETFLVVYGDLTINGKIIEKAIEAHKRRKPAATIVAVEVEDPWNYGVLKINKEKELIGVVEKPKKGEEPSHLINAAIYILDGEKIFKAIKETKRSKRGEYEITDTFQLLIDRGEKIIIYPTERSWWFDIGRPWDLLDANRIHMLKETSKQGWRRGIKIGRNVKIAKGVKLKVPVIIDDGCIIKKNSVIGPYTYLSKNVEVGVKSEIRESIILEETWIANYCSITKSIIGSHCTVESKVKFRSENKDRSTIKMTLKGRRVDTGRRRLGSVLGDYSTIGYGSIIEAGTTIYPKSIIQKRRLVYEDVEGVL